jgi:hypothetical protein
MMVNTKTNHENYYEGNFGSSSPKVEVKGWTTLWKTAIPYKLRVFLWRLAQQSLPTSYLLQHHHVSTTTSTCSLCGVIDSWRHSLLESDMARSIWALSDVSMVEHMEATTE